MFYLTGHDFPSLVEGESHGILFIIIIKIYRPNDLENNQIMAMDEDLGSKQS